MLFQTSTKLTFGLSDVFVVTVIASNGSLLFCDRILWFSKNMPQSLKSPPPPPPFWAGLITVIIIFIMKEKNYHKKINSLFSIQEFDFIYPIFFRVCILWLQMMHNRKLFWLEIMKLIKELVSYENEY